MSVGSAVIVSYPGGPATFQCVSTSTKTVDIKFIVNGSLFGSLTLENVTQRLLRGDMGLARAGTLRFVDLPVEYNNTDLQCRAEFSMGPPEISTLVVLLLQG